MTARIKVRSQRPGWRAVCTGLCWWGRSAESQQGALAAGLAHLTEAHPEQAEQVRMEALRRAWVAGMDAEAIDRNALSGSESRSEPRTHPWTREARSSASGPHSKPQTPSRPDRPTWAAVFDTTRSDS